MVVIERNSQRGWPVSASNDAIPERARRHGASPRQVFAACATGALVFAFFASRDLPFWAAQLPDGTLTQSLRGLADEWDQVVARLGLTLPHESLRRAIGRLRDQGWP